MTINNLCQLVFQTGFREPLQGRAKKVDDSVKTFIKRDYLNPSEEERNQLTKIAVYAIASYLALC